jgi:hypothetical protein
MKAVQRDIRIRARYCLPVIYSLSDAKPRWESKLKIVVWGALTTLMVATATVAQENTESANFMLPYCKLSAAQAGSKAFLAGRCAGLVQGVADVLALVKEANSDKLTPLCVDRPKGANTDQAVKLVVNYGDAHPEQTHAPFTIVATLALTEAWPCRK